MKCEKYKKDPLCEDFGNVVLQCYTDRIMTLYFVSNDIVVKDVFYIEG